jgi:hypothetical protein
MEGSYACLRDRRQGATAAKLSGRTSTSLSSRKPQVVNQLEVQTLVRDHRVAQLFQVGAYYVQILIRRREKVWLA